VGRIRRWRERRRKKRIPWEELEDLLALDPRQFEEAVAAIIRELGGRQVRITGRSGDLSVDITFRNGDGTSVAVQCKRYTPPTRVGSVEVQQFIGMAKLHHKADAAMYVTTSDYTRAARELARQHKDLTLIDGLMLAEVLANIFAAPGMHVLDPLGALKDSGHDAAQVAAEARARYAEAGELKELQEGQCQCWTADIQWAGHREPGGKRILVCPYCERIATPEEVHEAMISGGFGILEEVPGLEPLRRAVRERAEQRAIAEEDVRLGLVTVRASIIERKREQAARIALKQTLGRKPSEQEVRALTDAEAPPPEAGHVCSHCGREMPWSRRLDAYWCQTCSHAEYPIAGRIIRLMVPTN
jgi:Restriction endonuclease